MDEIINPKSVKVIGGEGMPVFKEISSIEDVRNQEKGDLIIKFNV